MKNFNIFICVSITVFLVALIVQLGIASEDINPEKQMYTASYVKEELTSHEWTLKEIVQTKNDTATNLTLFMLPCEKDNVLDFEINGTYQITEGEKLCKASDNKIKGKGEWSFEEADQTITDTYNEGLPIEKKVLELTSGMLKVQYEGEGRRITTLTYFSEIGLKDESLSDIVVDNSDYATNIALAPREILMESKRYIMVSRRDFEKGQPLSVDDKDGLLKKVIVYPFTNSINKAIVREDERNNMLIEQAKKVGLNYIITGNILKANVNTNADNTYSGHVKYTVSILDVESGEEIKRETYEHPKKEKKQSPIPNFPGILEIVDGVGLPFIYFGKRNRMWKRYYDYYFITKTADAVGDGLDVVFAEGNDTERKRHYESSRAVMQAIAQTTEDLDKYIKENIPLTIAVNKIETNKKGKFAGLIIEAGSNINMQEKETLNVVRIEENTLSNGKVVKSMHHIGKVKVASVNGIYLSTCKPGMSSKNKIEDAMNQNPEEIFVQTTYNKADKQ